MKLILQNSEQDCLLACVCMIMSNHGYDLTPGQLVSAELLPADGLSIGDLKDLEQRLGIRTRGFKDPDGLILKNGGHSPVPLIAHWQGSHFIVVEKIGHNRVKVVDPAIGRFTISKPDFLRSFTGIWVAISKEGELDRSILGSARKNRALKSFVNRGLWPLIYALGLGQASSILISWTIQQISATIHTFSFSVIMLVIIAVLYILSALTLSRSQNTLTRKFEERYSQSLFNGVLGQKFIFFKQYTIGGLLELIGLRGTIRDTILNNALPSAISFITVFVLVGYLAFISPIIAVAVCLMSLAYLAVSSFAIKNEQYASANYIQEQVSFSSKMQEDLSNIIETKALRTENIVADRWIKANKKLYLSFVDTLRSQNISTMVRNIFYAAIIIIVATFSLIFYERSQLAVGDLVVLQAITGMFAGSINSFQTFLTAVARSRIYEHRQYGLWPSQEHISDFPASFNINDKNESPSDEIITLKDASYSYPHRAAVFENLHLSIERGEKIAILGASGTGKSTLLYLLLGLLEPVAGEVSVRFDSHKKLGVVLSGMELQQSSLRENLIYDGHFNDQEIFEVLQIVGLDSLVKTLPLGLESTVLQNGSNLSSGQSQRLLIARSLLRGSDVVAWDEALSRLDQLTRNELYRRLFLNPSYQFVTMLIISHHSDIIPFMDKIIFIRSADNRVLIGQHKDLLNDEEYRRYFNREETDEFNS